MLETKSERFREIANNGKHFTSYTQEKEEEEQKTYKWDIAWGNVIALGLIHLMALYGFYLRFNVSLKTHIYCKLLGTLSNIGITAGAHRLWCHNSYKANSIVQIIFIILTSSTYQNSIYVWCRDHRMHHKYSETDADPHNAKRGFFFSHMGWLLVRKHPDVKSKGKTIDMSDLEANPIVMFQHKYYYIIVFVFALVIPASITYFICKETLAVSIFTSCVYRYVISVHLTWCINSLAHLYGNKPYDRSIGPTENPVMLIMGLGEGFHNYHHTFPWDYKAAEYGNDTRNLTTFLIDTFAKLGWVTDRKVAPKQLITKRVTNKGDGTYMGNEYYEDDREEHVRKRLYHNLKNLTLFIVVVGLI